MRPYRPNLSALEEALLSSKRPRIAVMGDFCLDKYLYIDAALDEPSVETGLTAYQVRRKALYPGAAGTIANNLAALGAELFCFGLCGDDGEGYELRRCLHAIGADTDGLLCADGLFTATYTKPMRQSEGVWKELNRLDMRTGKAAPRPAVEQVLSALKRVVDCGAIDAVVISDQFTLEAGSVLSPATRAAVSDLAGRHPEIFFLADSRSYAGEYRQMMIKCNASELLDLAGRRRDGGAARVAADPSADSRQRELLAAGAHLAAQNGRDVLVTRGKAGSFLFSEGTVTAIEPFEVTGPIDICGAGDATDAAFVLGVALGLPRPDAALLAAAVSSITIQQIGVTGTATRKEALERIASKYPR